MEIFVGFTMGGGVARTHYSYYPLVSGYITSITKKRGTNHGKLMLQTIPVIEQVFGVGGTGISQGITAE